MAHKKAQGAVTQKGNRAGKRRGVKKYGGESVFSGTIILRQVGSVIHAGENVGMGRDFTLFAKKEGIVKYKNLSKTKKAVSIVSTEEKK